MTITKYPINAVVMPSSLACGAKNGQLGTSVLVDIGHGGRLEHTAARAWNALYVTAKANGHDLTWTPGGTYRPLADQQLVFMQRMTTDASKGVRPAVTRFYLGQTWYLLPGDAMVATPGTSNHGLGLAIDTAVGPDPQHAQPITDGHALDWLLANVDGKTTAESFGFSWESDSEAWHIRYTAGDTIPQRVLDVEAFFANMTR